MSEVNSERHEFVEDSTLPAHFPVGSIEHSIATFKSMARTSRKQSESFADNPSYVSVAMLHKGEAQMLEFCARWLEKAHVHVVEPQPLTEREPLKSLLEGVERLGGFLFWVCPRGCNDRVVWDHSRKPEVATCQKCGATSVSSETSHEFESFDDKCCVPVGLGLLPCGEPKDAAIHEALLTVEEKLAAMRLDSEYQFRARRILKESELSVGIPLAADSIPNDLAIRIAIALAERDKLAKRKVEPAGESVSQRVEDGLVEAQAFNRVMDSLGHALSSITSNHPNIPRFLVDQVWEAFWATEADLRRLAARSTPATTGAARRAAEKIVAVAIAHNQRVIGGNITYGIEQIRPEVAAIITAEMGAQPSVCTWRALTKREWMTTCGVSTEVFNSCHKFCGFCGRSVKIGESNG